MTKPEDLIDKHALAEAFFNHPKWSAYKDFAKEYLSAMSDYLAKHPEKSPDPYFEFFIEIITLVRHEQEKIQFKNEIGDEDV